MEPPYAILAMNLWRFIGLPRGVDNERETCPGCVEDESYKEMSPLESPFGHSAPAVIVGVERRRLEKEEERVVKRRRPEYRGQVPHELRIEEDEREKERSARYGSEREGGHADPEELVGDPVVARVFFYYADDFEYEDEYRHGEHEGREPEVHLRGHPDGKPSVNSVRRRIIARAGRRRGNDRLACRDEIDREQQREEGDGKEDFFDRELFVGGRHPPGSP